MDGVDIADVIRGLADELADEVGRRGVVGIANTVGLLVVVVLLVGVVIHHVDARERAKEKERLARLAREADRQDDSTRPELV